MQYLAELLRRLHYLMNRSRLERELAQEMEAHRNIMGEPERFGNTLRLREESRDIWGWNWLDDLWTDLRYSFRQLFEAPAFTVLALVTLAIGIGANTALFSVVNTVLLSPPPVRNPALLRQIEWSDRFQPGIVKRGLPEYSYPVFKYVRGQSSTFSDVLCLKYGVNVNIRIQGSLDRATADFVSANFFQSLGGRPILGRLLVPPDDEPDATPVAVLNEAAWQRYFAGNSSVIGQTITVNGIRVVILGVIPQDFDLPTPGRRGSPVLKLPMSQYAAVTNNPGALTSNAATPCRMIGIQRAGASNEQVRIESERLVREAFAVHTPASRAGRQFPAIEGNSARVGLRRVDRGIDQLELRGGDLPQVFIALLLPWAILLISCANIAGMLLARAASRRGEIATRLAMGAPRQRLIRQLLTESIVLAALGGSLGLPLCYLLGNPFAAVFGIPFAVDLRVLAFTAGLSMMTGLLFGLVPALDATRIDLASVSKQESAFLHGRSKRMGNRLVTVQVALSFVLLIAAGIQVQRLLSIGGRGANVAPERVLIISVDASSAEYTNEQVQRFIQESTARLALLPGVESVSLTQGILVPRYAEFPAVQMPVGPGFFKTMNIPLLAGRDVNWMDKKTAVVNAAFARKYFPDSNPLGQTVRCYEHLFDKVGSAFTVIGIVGDSDIPFGVSFPQRPGLAPTAYMAIGSKEAGTKRWGFSLIVRTAIAASNMIAPARRVMAEVDPEILVGETGTAGDAIGWFVGDRRRNVIVFSSFGLIALLQAAFGIYGTLSYFVNRRTPEIGLRIALGAERKDVVRLVVRQSTGAILRGLVIGVIVAVPVTLAAQNGSITAARQFATLGAALFLAAVAIVAACAPAWRATRIDPTQALRHE